MKLKEIMTSDPDVVRPDTKLIDAARLMRDLDIGSIPVCDGDRLQGVITDRDITVRATADGMDPTHAEVGLIMTPDVVYGFEDQEVEDGAVIMEEHQIRRLVVLNRDKQLTGIVTLGDIAVKCGEDALSAEILDEVSQPATPAR